MKTPRSVSQVQKGTKPVNSYLIFQSLVKVIEITAYIYILWILFYIFSGSCLISSCQHIFSDILNICQKAHLKRQMYLFLLVNSLGNNVPKINLLSSIRKLIPFLHFQLQQKAHKEWYYLQFSKEAKPEAIRKPYKMPTNCKPAYYFSIVPYSSYLKCARTSSCLNKLSTEYESHRFLHSFDFLVEKGRLDACHEIQHFHRQEQLLQSSPCHRLRSGKHCY